MTRTVQLTQHYISNILQPMLLSGMTFTNGKHFTHIPEGQIAEGEHYKIVDIMTDPNRVPIYNCCQCINQIRIQSFKIYSCNTDETMQIPESVFNNLKGIVEEVI